MTTAETIWDPDRRLLLTRLSGIVEAEHVQRWKASLEHALAQLGDGTQFKLVVDLVGYEVAEMEAHRQMRTVVPRMLAEHGFRTALLDLFDDVELPIDQTRGMVCSAVAHVHHDAGKMALYDEQLGRPNERFFSHIDPAIAWIGTVA